jgi:2-hydroxy-6-oxonona-2,4-dienedioate hydrolase
MLKPALSALAIAVTVFAVVAAIAYTRAMDRAYERIRGRSTVIASPFGDIEYTHGGSGPAVLVVHGSGGGFDQGQFLAQAALDDRFRCITPSRFGYLRSTFRPGATFDDQAHAYAHLLDQLGIRQVAVVAFSQGGPSALLFALLHPERVSSLTLLSAGVASTDSPEQQQANSRGDALMKIFQHDIAYWVVTTAFSNSFLRLMGVTDAIIDGLTPQQRRLAEDLIEGMNPVAPRAAGTVFDNRAKMPNERIAAIRAPTLILHARDDTLQRFHNAEFAARTIPGARLVPFDRGGHLLLAVEQPTIRELVAQHIVEHQAAR